MDTQTGIEIIAAMRDSLERDPSQFTLEIKVTGQHIESHGGTGLHISATGGGPESTTIGQIVSLEGSQIEIAQGRGSEAMRQQMAALVASLDKMVVELQKAKPDNNVLKRLFESIRGTWVPGVITSVIGTVLASIVNLKCQLGL